MVGLGSAMWRIGSGVWLGTMVFFSFVVAPVLFYSLSPANAGLVITRIFPSYYAVGVWFGGGAVAGGLLAAVWLRRPGRWWVWVPMAAAYGVLLYARHLLTVMNRLDPSGTRFSHLHQLSVTLNGVVMFLVLVAMAAEAWVRAG